MTTFPSTASPETGHCRPANASTAATAGGGAAAPLEPAGAAPPAGGCGLSAADGDEICTNARIAARSASLRFISSLLVCANGKGRRVIGAADRRRHLLLSLSSRRAPAAIKRYHTALI